MILTITLMLIQVFAYPIFGPPSSQTATQVDPYAYKMERFAQLPFSHSQPSLLPLPLLCMCVCVCVYFTARCIEQTMQKEKERGKKSRTNPLYH